MTFLLLLSLLTLHSCAALELPLEWSLTRRAANLDRRSFYDVNRDGTKFVWVPQDEYRGKTFFDRWTFFDHPDPTNGHVNYVNKSYAQDKGLIYVQDDGIAIMKADAKTSLPRGTFRDSVRIESQTKYNTGLFILDLNQAPWGCGTWPAFWTVGDGWPWNGEIDIIEGVHDNQHNQVAWHTAPGCTLDTSANFTGNIANGGGYNHTDCNALINYNAGCGVTEWSRASYGPLFDEQGGGVFIMKWDENGIAVWSFFRASIPADIIAGTPNPSQWGSPSASLLNTNCNITKFFAWHAIVFDITFCGDWAGNSYATSGCPGTCEDRLMDPANFVNATWSINYLKIFRKMPVNATVENAALPIVNAWGAQLCLLVLGIAVTMNLLATIL